MGKMKSEINSNENIFKMFPSKTKNNFLLPDKSTLVKACNQLKPTTATQNHPKPVKTTLNNSQTCKTSHNNKLANTIHPKPTKTMENHPKPLITTQSLAQKFMTVKG